MTSPLDAEDMEKLERSIASLRSLGGEEIDLVLAELERTRIKLDEISRGQTVLLMSDQDRKTRVQDLDDATLAAWSRWVFLNMERVREGHEAKVSKPEDQDVMTVGALQGVIGLALMTFSARNSHLSFTTEGVTFDDEALGDWQVDIRQIRKPNGDTVCDPAAVAAEVHSDDHKASTSFDARPILAQIEYGWLLDLARCNWGGDQPADDVALMVETFNADVSEVMKYVRTAECGFECTMDGEAALSWLKDNRPDAWGWLTAELEKEGKY